MATGRNAGKLVALDVRHGLSVGSVDCALLEAARAQMAMQALTIIKRLVQPDGIRRTPDVVLVGVNQAAKLVPESAIDGVVGVAGGAGQITGEAAGLKKGWRDIAGNVHVKTSSAGPHAL